MTSQASQSSLHSLPIGPESQPTARVAYLTKRFPRLSETFILDEILGLEHHGVNLRLFAQAHPGESLTQADVEKVRSPVTYLTPPQASLRPLVDPSKALSNGLAVARSHLRVLKGQPRRYLNVVSYIIRKRRSKTAIKHFVIAGRFADLTLRDDTAHIHAAFAHGPASIAHLTSLLTGIPFSFSAHAKDLYLSAPDLMARKVAASEFVLVCSQSAQFEMNRLVRAHRDPDVGRRGQGKVFLQYHGVNVDRFTPAEPQQQHSGDRATASLHQARECARPPVRILAVGRLVPKKGYFVLLAALRAVADSGRSFQCRIVGTGPLKDELSARISELHLDDKITLVGARTQVEIASEYQNNDVFVQSSIIMQDGDRDGVPNSVLEAMASAMAVVGTNVAGIPEVVSNAESGLIVPTGDPKALSEAINSLLDNSELRLALGSAARLQTVEKMSRDLCVAEVAKRFLDQVVTASQTARGGTSVAPRLLAS